LRELEESISQLEKYIKSEDYKGYDPYDSLMSPVFKLPVLKSNKLIRFGCQQVYRRIPFNTRGLLGIKKGINPVTLGLCIQAYTYLSLVFPDRRINYMSEIEKLLDKLIELKSVNFSGVCWGYDFDWEARYARIPAFYPTIVATGIITNSLFINYSLLKNSRSLDLCIDAVNFALKDLNKSFDGETFCYSYSPNDKQKVLNATMKGARLLSQVYSVTKDISLFNEAQKTVEYVINNQNENGSWPYSRGDARKWVDNFHTGYILDALNDFIYYTDSNIYVTNLEEGYEFYLRNFFYENEIPKYFENRLYPVDSTAIAQSILTLARFGNPDLAKKSALWGINNMRSDKGCFYFRKTGIYVNKTPYMRWVNAWMFAALSYLLYKTKVVENV
jgi:hypothetical protein